MEFRWIIFNLVGGRLPLARGVVILVGFVTRLYRLKARLDMRLGRVVTTATVDVDLMLLTLINHLWRLSYLPSGSRGLLLIGIGSKGKTLNLSLQSTCVGAFLKVSHCGSDLADFLSLYFVHGIIRFWFGDSC